MFSKPQQQSYLVQILDLYAKGQRKPKEILYQLLENEAKPCPSPPPPPQGLFAQRTLPKSPLLATLLKTLENEKTDDDLKSTFWLLNHLSVATLRSSGLRDLFTTFFACYPHYQHHLKTDLHVLFNKFYLVTPMFEVELDTLLIALNSSHQKQQTHAFELLNSHKKQIVKRERRKLLNPCITGLNSSNPTVRKCCYAILNEWFKCKRSEDQEAILQSFIDSLYAKPNAFDGEETCYALRKLLPFTNKDQHSQIATYLLNQIKFDDEKITEAALKAAFKWHTLMSKEQIDNFYQKIIQCLQSSNPDVVVTAAQALVDNKQNINFDCFMPPHYLIALLDHEDPLISVRVSLLLYSWHDLLSKDELETIFKTLFNHLKSTDLETRLITYGTFYHWRTVLSTSACARIISALTTDLQDEQKILDNDMQIIICQWQSFLDETTCQKVVETLLANLNTPNGVLFQDRCETLSFCQPRLNPEQQKEVITQIIENLNNGTSSMKLSASHAALEWIPFMPLSDWQETLGLMFKLLFDILDKNLIGHASIDLCQTINEFIKKAAPAEKLLALQKLNRAEPSPATLLLSRSLLCDYSWDFSKMILESSKGIKPTCGQQQAN